MYLYKHRHTHRHMHVRYVCPEPESFNSTNPNSSCCRSRVPEDKHHHVKRVSASRPRSQLYVWICHFASPFLTRKYRLFVLLILLNESQWRRQDVIVVYHHYSCNLQSQGRGAQTDLMHDPLPFCFLFNLEGQRNGEKRKDKIIISTFV